MFCGLTSRWMMPLGVGVLQGAQDLSRQSVMTFFPGQGTAALLVEIFFSACDAVHILHDDVLQFVGDRYIIDPWTILG